MTNPLQQIKDRRKPWHKTLVNLKLARCGAMLAERVAEFGRANDAAARDLNKCGGRYGERPSERQIQYWLHMTGQHCGHHATIAGRDIPIDHSKAAEWLKARGLMP